MRFLETLREQRWDDHRYYHHSRINQTLHLVSALCFLTSYALIAFDPVTAVLLGWFVAMWSRQIGHFVFEPKGFDHVNHVSHEHKEDIKVGYNLERKVVLLSIWAATPVALAMDPTLFGMFEAHANRTEFVDHLARLWLVIGAGAVVFRTLQLFVVRDVETGLVWATKILTDPFHDVKMYHRAPFRLLRGELLDPMGESPEHARAA
ncbi:MAG: Mpo1-like protein [Planctomycetota bacterium JB042]